MKKLRNACLCSLLATILLVSSIPAFAFERVFNVIQLSEDVVYLTEAKNIEVEVDLGYEPKMENLEWTLSGRKFDDWKKYDDEKLVYDGEPMITFVKAPYYENGKVKAVIKFDIAHEDAKDDYARNINLNVYQPMIGTHYLAVTDTAKGAIYNGKITFTIYEDFHTYGQIKPDIDRIINGAKLNRYVEYVSLGATEEGRNIHFAVLAKDKASVEKYLNETLPLMLSDPAKLQAKLKSGSMGDYKLPIWFGNIHPQEMPCVDGIINVLETLASEDTFSYNVYGRDHVDRTAEASGKHLKTDKLVETVTVDIDKLLDNVIVLFDFTTNPDGREMYQRFNGKNFDLNRDCAIQTQAESKAVLNAIGKWRPTIFLEYHGYFPEFVIEPCTPPHDPNVDVDLLLPSNLELAYAMGDAGIGNTIYKEFQIPYIDLESGWEDLSPNFTDFYVQSLGCIGNIVEIPWPDKDSRMAIEYTTYAALNYLSSNKDKLFENQLEYYRRGVEGLDVKEKVDPYMIGPDGTAVGRPRGDNDNFFPEYYVIPVDSSLQRNPSEAYHIVDLMLNSGVEVCQTTKNVKVSGTTYPKGSFVVDMHQATRALANNLLYEGVDTSEYPSVYSENLISTPHTFGYDRIELRTPGVFKTTGFLRKNIVKIDSVVVPSTTTVPEGSDYYLIKNTSNNSIRAVNGLLNTNIEVRMLTSSGSDAVAGDFVINKEGINLVKNKFFLDVVPYHGSETYVTLKEPKVNVKAVIRREEKDGGLEFALEKLGFDLVDNQKNANIIVATSDYDVKELVQSGTPYIGLGQFAAKFVKKSNLLPGFDYQVPNSSSDEALVYSDMSKEDPITARYAKHSDASFYLGRGVLFTSVPENATVLASVATKDNFMIAGNWPGKEVLKGKPLVFSAPVGNTIMTVFSGNMTYKALAQDSWRMIANAIYSATANR